MSEIVYAGFKGRQNNKSNTMTWISPQAYLGQIPFFHKLVSLPSLVPLFPEHLPINIFLFFHMVDCQLSSSMCVLDYKDVSLYLLILSVHI